MANRIGIIAGSGEFPFVVLEEAMKLGRFPVVAGISGEAEIRLEENADIFEWIDAGAVQRLIAFFKKNAVKEAVFAGKVDQKTIFAKDKFNGASLKILARIRDQRPASLIKAVIDLMQSEGIQILDPTQFIASSFCEEGVVTKTQPLPEIKDDIEFGWKIAKGMADLDVGQAVVVKERVVVAVEGIEGTDEAIKRGGQLAGKNTVVIKVSRTSQDPRVDLPSVGLNTVKSLVSVQGQALCFEAKSVPFFQKDEAILIADANKIAIVAKKL